MDAGFFEPAREAGFLAVDAGLALAFDAGFAEEAGFSSAAFDSGLAAAAFEAGLPAALEAGLAALEAGLAYE